MRFVIMADGKGARWNNYLQRPKHFVEVNGEHIIVRTIRLLKQLCGDDTEIIVTSHDARYEFDGCIRHEPIDNRLEIDRFTEELITDDMCFLYGDTYYSDDTMKKIILLHPEDILFFGNQKSIVAVKIKDAGLFRRHVKNVKKLYLEGKIDKCVGWQVYQSFTGQDLRYKPAIGSKFVLVDEKTRDINTPEEYEVM